MTTQYAPDGLEICPEHPDALVRHVYDVDCYAWPNGHVTPPVRRRTVGYECSVCSRPLTVMDGAA